jgi:hypothetical protein
VSKRKNRLKRSDWKQVEASGEAVRAALEARAVTLSKINLHRLSSWQPAKKKWGKGAKQAWCPDCCGAVIVLPYGSPRGPQRYQKNPMIMGDLVFEVCGMEAV